MELKKLACGESLVKGKREVCLGKASQYFDRRTGSRATALEVQLPGGEIVRGSEASEVAKLVSLLRG